MSLNLIMDNLSSKKLSNSKFRKGGFGVNGIFFDERVLNSTVCAYLHIASLFEKAEEFDLIHNYFDFIPLSYSRLISTPMVTTIGGFSSSNIL